MKFIIYSPIYREDSGGVIVLHKLCSLLNEQGHEALIWHDLKPTMNEFSSIIGWKKLLKYIGNLFFQYQNVRSPYGLKRATMSDIESSVVIYPEIVEGNPLYAEKVVRWLLNKPSAITGKTSFEQGDLIYFYHPHFNDWVLNPNAKHHLNLMEIMDDTYNQTNFGVRHGCCHMVRKGENRIHDQHPEGSILLDGKSHSEIAEIFNRCEYFVSYDLYTMYSRYAAMCGCIPIVVPANGVTKEFWRPDIQNRYGIAYGWDEIDWAVSTRRKLLSLLRETESRSSSSVQSFTKGCEDYFTQMNVKDSEKNYGQN